MSDADIMAAQQYIAAVTRQLVIEFNWSHHQARAFARAAYCC